MNFFIQNPRKIVSYIRRVHYLTVLDTVNSLKSKEGNKKIAVMWFCLEQLELTDFSLGYLRAWKRRSVLEPLGYLRASEKLE